MNHRNRKDNHLGRKGSESAVAPILKSALVVSSLAAIVGAAHAQSGASTQTAIDYSFTVDGGSADPSSDLAVTDNGILTYNLVVPFPFTPPPGPYYAPYTSTTGADASASTFNSPLTGYDGLTMTGYSGVGSYAALSGSTGAAEASLGKQENLVLTDTGPNSITLDISATAFNTGGASAVGGTEASESGYAGIYAYDQATGAQLDYNLLKLVSTAPGTSTYSTIGNMTPIAGGEYASYSQLTINSGQQVGLQFYTSGVAEVNAVPSPTGVATLGFGLAALLIRRRRTRR